MNLRTQLDFFHDPGPDVPALVAAGALFVINHSGGKDSQLMFHHVKKLVPARQMICIHAPLKDVEWPGALELARDQAAAAGVRFILAHHHREISLLDKVAEKHAKRPDCSPWPSDGQRWCTSDWKTGPCRREARRYANLAGFTTVVNCLGLRASESWSRFKELPWSLNEEQTNSRRTWYDWLPIHNVFTPEVFAQLDAAGLVPHHAYGLGNERLSCCFCIYGSSSDLRNGALHNPELYARYVELEQQTGYTMHMSRKSLPELTGLSVRQARQLHALNFSTT
ncbi:phosphoadenosine phosphosulfate reductase family protein [Hymenobacter sp. 15J16-1T3B]|uniref:phosphoadenosine phosphosulfate reductase domain-containing protein n=1 Tax=Hymenobacter sp. 15J16-1T3B TaxID=2886941 RepID=UPI001D0FD6B4|nr:phosphoadenosine phosphosulfate reductase family protein [Hymenobacter sp. 15J16-1T3B]MCC3156458.1 phosphoadenosine phosphosulfate reductase family protein [Hymenobacter sp. 15J16-1T3B]